MLREVVAPVERMTCSTVGIAIGTAARASAIARREETWVDWPREIPSANMIDIVRPAAPAIHSVKVSSCAVSGVFGLRRLQHPRDVSDFGVGARVR